MGPSLTAIIITIICICFIIFSFLIIQTYSSIQLYLDRKVENKEITLYSRPVAGLCPTKWLKKKYTNGIFCIEPAIYSIVDIDNNFIDAKKGNCTTNKEDKQYFCEVN